MLADLSIHNVEDIEIGPVRINDTSLDAHREIKVHTKQGVITLTLWGRCDPAGEETTVEITL